jgi:hypothetical protein
MPPHWGSVSLQQLIAGEAGGTLEPRPGMTYGGLYGGPVRARRVITYGG